MLIDSRERGREGERERNVDQLSLARASTRDWTCNLDVCPQPGTEPMSFWFMGQCSSQLSHTGQGLMPPSYWRDQLLCGMCLLPHGFILTVSLLPVLSVNFNALTSHLDSALASFWAGGAKDYFRGCAVYFVRHPWVPCHVTPISQRSCQVVAVQGWVNRWPAVGGTDDKDPPLHLTERFHPLRVFAWISY